MGDRYDQERERHESSNRSEWGNRPNTREDMREGRNWSEGNREDWRDRREWDQGRDYGGRHEGWRSNESQTGSERGSWEGRSRQNEGRWSSDEGRSGYGYEPRRGESRWEESNRGNEWRSGNSERGNEGRWGEQTHVSRQGGNWGDTRGQSNYEGRGWNPGRDLSYREPMTGTHRGEWSSGHGVGMSLGSAEHTEYSPMYARSGSYYGGQGEFGGGLGQYGERGRHAGRGPKGYKRSDERIKEDVCERLTQDPNVDASEIDVQVKEGEVTLTGSVDSRDQKRRAEDAIENLSGVREVNNQLRVQSGQMAGASRGANAEAGTTTTGQQTTKK
jgi:hypothetical protein